MVPDPDRPSSDDEVAPALEDLRAELTDALERLDDAVEGSAGGDDEDRDDDDRPVRRDDRL
jgi:hypothetical protein